MGPDCDGAAAHAHGTACPLVLFLPLYHSISSHPIQPNCRSIGSDRLRYWILNALRAIGAESSDHQLILSQSSAWFKLWIRLGSRPRHRHRPRECGWAGLSWKVRWAADCGLMQFENSCECIKINAGWLLIQKGLTDRLLFISYEEKIMKLCSPLYYGFMLVIILF